MPRKNQKSKKKKKNQEHRHANGEGQYVSHSIPTSRATGTTITVPVSSSSSIVAATASTPAKNDPSSSLFLPLQNLRSSPDTILADIGETLITERTEVSTTADRCSDERDHHDNTGGRPSQETSEEDTLLMMPALYSQYKHATEHFKSSLLQLVSSYSSKTTPSKTNTKTRSKNTSSCSNSCRPTTSTGTTKTSSQQMLDAVDWVYETVIGDDADDADDVDDVTDVVAIDPQMMMYLKTALSTRRRLMKYHQDDGGGDIEGHRFHYNTLLYCWDTLHHVIKFQQQRTAIMIEGKNAATADGPELVDLSNRFDILSMMCDDGWDEMEAMDRNERSAILSNKEQDQGRRPRPELSQAFEYDDEAYAYISMFLTGIDGRMGSIAKHYQQLNNYVTKIVTTMPHPQRHYM